MLALALAACTDAPDDRPRPRPDPTGGTGATGGPTADTGASTPDPTGGTGESGPPPDVVAALEAEGFVVGEGAFLFSDMSGCCDPGAQCWGNNPSTPYGTPMLPPAPGEIGADTVFDTLEDMGPVPGGLLRTFRLRPDEAFVTLGALPPGARYFSFRSYLAHRPGISHQIVGSLGPSLNHRVMEAERGRSPLWGEPFAIVTSLDAGAEARAVAGLVAAGWDPRTIHADRITGEVVNPGLLGASDAFFVLVRTGVFDDPVAGEAWRADPGWRVLRLTPAAEEAWDEPWPWPVLPARGTGRAEDPDLADAAADLLAAVLRAYPDHDATVAPAAPYWYETLQCVDREENCGGDIRDRYAAISPEFRLGEGELLVSLGVNHEATGKAVYSSSSVQTIESQRGIESFESPEMPGSARAFLPLHPRADELYAWTVARDCAGVAGPCSVVPTGCPGVPYDEALKITVRAYLEPWTGAAPVPEEIVPDAVVKLVPRR